MNVHAKCGHVKGSTNVIKPQTQLNIILNTLESSVFSRVLKVKALCGFSCNISVSQCVHGLFPGHLDALASLHKVSLRISFGLIKSYQGLNKYIGYSLYNLHGLSAEVWSSPVRGLSLMSFFFQDFFLFTKRLWRFFQVNNIGVVIARWVQNDGTKKGGFWMF